ncbi:MAG TPA: FHA domain-containing protein [Thermoanaerobaculia bacterium]
MRIQFGDYIFDNDAREVRRGIERLHLTPKAFDLLDILVRERPRAVTKQELQDRLWPDVIVDDANLKNLVAEIRSVMDAEAVRTVQRYGYALSLSDDAHDVAARLIDGDRIHKLKAGENIIGRDDGCTVVLASSGVSRRHAAIRIAGDRATLEELGSKNGTWHNEERVVGSTELRDGDRIRLGGVRMTFRSKIAAENTMTIDDEPTAPLPDTGSTEC